MTKVDPYIEKLKDEIKKMNEKYNQLQVNFQLQREKIQNIDLRKKTLQSMVEKAKASRLAASERLNQIKDNELKKKDQIRLISEEMRKEISQKYTETSKSINEKKELYDVLKTRSKFLKEKFKRCEKDYLITLSELDQKLLMIRAKEREVTARINVLTKYAVSDNIIDNNNTDNEFDGNLDDDLSISADIKALISSLQVQEKTLASLEEDCRNLQMQRNELMKQ